MAAVTRIMVMVEVIDHGTSFCNSRCNTHVYHEAEKTPLCGKGVESEPGNHNGISSAIFQFLLFRPRRQVHTPQAMRELKKNQCRCSLREEEDTNILILGWLSAFPPPSKVVYNSASLLSFSFLYERLSCPLFAAETILLLLLEKREEKKTSSSLLFFFSRSKKKKKVFFPDDVGAKNTRGRERRLLIVFFGGGFFFFFRLVRVIIYCDVGHI